MTDLFSDIHHRWCIFMELLPGLGLQSSKSLRMMTNLPRYSRPARTPALFTLSPNTSIDRRVPHRNEYQHTSYSVLELAFTPNSTSKIVSTYV